MQRLPKIYKNRPIPKLLRFVLNKQGWRKAEENEQCTLNWKSSRHNMEEFDSSTEELLNHFPQSHNITKKGHLQFLLKQSYLRYGDIYNFFPSSYVFSLQSQDLIKKYFTNQKDKIWIAKPPASSQGRGIVITRDIEEFSKLLQIANDRITEAQKQRALQQEVMDDQHPLTETDHHQQQLQHTIENPILSLNPVPPPLHLFVLQEYISNPFLISGYKSDLRLYVLVTNFHPLKVFLYTDGMIRFCTKKYSVDDLDPLRHLTNTSIQTKLMQKGKIPDDVQEEFEATLNNTLGVGDFSKRRLRAFFNYLDSQNIDYQQMWKQIKKVILLTLLPLVEEMKPVSKNCFELFGFDILLTEDLKPKLIEVNLAPSLGVSAPTDVVIKQPMLNDMLDIVMDVAPPRPPRQYPVSEPIHEDILLPRNKKPSARDFGSGDFELVFPFNTATAEASNELALRFNVKVCLLLTN
eukprot:TRINITY_DN1112_c0_g3_i2.p1 TRINITY_DN1112_c0_g3~~TRINITY_DN1112_c0_g3_i2.p1  ORF type:complete len:464 (-),score=96.89 TRINITY_DN1112_c0_g3_i2:80-1471(-)